MAKGVPFVVLTVISLLLLKRNEMSNAAISFFAAWFYLPWLLTPWMSRRMHHSDIRRWIIGSQLAMTLLLLALSLCLSSASLVPLMVCLLLLSFVCATHDTASRLLLDEYSYAREATRRIGRLSYFFSLIVAQGLLIMLGGNMEVLTRDISYSWSIVLCMATGLMLLLTGYHFIQLPKPEEESQGQTSTMQDKQTGKFCAFCLLYLLPYGLIIMMATLFLIDLPHTGGLGLSPAEYGLAMGTVGIIGAFVGGSVGRRAIHAIGLRACIWLMTAAMTVPSIIYWALSIHQDSQLFTICLSILIAQFAIGFGTMAFRAYIIYIMKASSALWMGIAMSALAGLLPGLVAGWLQEAVGYPTFFLIAIGCSLSAFIASAIVWKNIPAEIGKPLT